MLRYVYYRKHCSFFSARERCRSWWVSDRDPRFAYMLPYGYSSRYVSTFKGYRARRMCEYIETPSKFSGVGKGIRICEVALARPAEGPSNHIFVISYALFA